MSAPKKGRIESSKDRDVWMKWLEISSGEENPLVEEDEDDVEEKLVKEATMKQTRKKKF